MRVCVCVNTRVVYDDFFFEASASLISSSLKKIDPLGLVLLLLLLSLFFRVSSFRVGGEFFFSFLIRTHQRGERGYFLHFFQEKNINPKKTKTNHRKTKKEREREREKSVLVTFSCVSFLFRYTTYY